MSLYFESKVSAKKIISCVAYDKAHGRLETRECFVFNDAKWLRDRYPNWKTINSVIKINSIREFKDTNKTTREIRYYITSLTNTTPDVVLQAVREHWGIENSLHWILDMSFNEDYSRIRKENAPHVIAIIRHIALNLLQLGKPKRQSIKGFKKMCSWDNSALTKLISKNAHQLSS